MNRKLTLKTNRSDVKTAYSKIAIEPLNRPETDRHCPELLYAPAPPSVATHAVSISSFQHNLRPATAVVATPPSKSLTVASLWSQLGDSRNPLHREVSSGNRSHRHHSLPSRCVVLSDVKPLPPSRAPFLIPQSYTYSHCFSPKHNPSLHRAAVGRTVAAWFIVVVLQSSCFVVLEGPSIPPTPILLLIDDKLIPINCYW
ncbi:uncharacterized protein DS421_16g565320 [Arachis hypogaea]|nr:uncharacterized protein DS421_16g565320 [Arachis hypogaea]